MKNPFSPTEFPAIIEAVAAGCTPAGVQVHGDLAAAKEVPLRIVPITGEQTNFSFVVDDSTIWKFYADLPDGLGQEVRIATALRSHVPPFVGHLSLNGSTLCVVTRFLPGAADLWSLRETAALPTLTPSLGATLGTVHAELADAFGSSATSGAHRADALHDRLATFRARTDLLEPFVSDALRSYDALATVDSLPTQAIHGDLHLGQILLADNELYYLDFEGEPGATSSPVDSPMRDIAGLIRSFHYAGLPFDLDDFAPTYATTRRFPVDEVVLRAYVIDRFCYEVVYELDHRPDWVQFALASARFVF